MGINGGEGEEGIVFPGYQPGELLANKPLARLPAEQLTGATVFRFDADDSMPSTVQKAFWKGTLDYLQDPLQLDNILADIEATALDAY